MKLIKDLTLVACAAALLFQTSITRADDQSPQRIAFQKCVVADGTLTGTVAGDCGVGTIVFTYLSVSPGKAIWHFSGEYAIDTPDCSFKTVCAGIVDVRTGHVVLNGVVTEGDHLGASVQVRAQANATLTCSSGTLTIGPESAD